MQQVLQGIEGVSVYQDDVLVFGRDRSEHDSRLRAVFKAMEKRGLKLRLDKCAFGLQEVEYLGHLISKSGIAPRPGLT